MDVVAVVRLDYVGSPPSVAFGKIMPTIGYDLALSKLGRYRQQMGASDTASETAMRTSGTPSSAVQAISGCNTITSRPH